MAKRRLTSLGTLLLTLGLSCAAAPPPAPHASAKPTPAVTPADRAKLGEMVDAYVAGFGSAWGEAYAPSGYLLVAKDGVPILERSYGAAHPTADTQFRIGSLTKQITAVAALQVLDQRHLGIDAPIRRVLPELPASYEAVTVQHLLHHTSGIPSYTEVPSIATIQQRTLSRAEVVALFVDKPLEFAPGSSFHYSNSNYFLLGMAIERLTGRTYEEVLQSNVLGPAGMRRTGSVENGPRTNAAIGMSPDDDDRLRPADPIDMSVPFAAGALHSTARDLVLWDRALASEKVLPHALETIRTTPAREGYACGVSIEKVVTVPVETHGGRINGFSAGLTRIPDRGLAVVFLSNVDSFDAGELVDHVVKIVLTGVAELPPPERPLGAFDAEAAKRFAGDYVLAATSREALNGKLPKALLDSITHTEVTAAPDRLIVTHGGKRPFRIFPARTPNTWFTKRSGITITFGERGFTLHQGPFDLIFERAM